MGHPAKDSSGRRIAFNADLRLYLGELLRYLAAWDLDGSTFAQTIGSTHFFSGLRAK
jgi:hypothetical protein